MSLKFKSIIILAIILISAFTYFKVIKNHIKKETKHANSIIIGYAQLGSESGWRLANTASVQQAAKDYDVNLIFRNADGDQKLQKQIIQDFIIQQVDVIIFPPIVTDGWDAILAEAKKAKIPVILADRNINTKNPDLYTVFIGSDFLEEGRKAGRWLINNVKTNKEINVLEISGLPDSAPTVDRAMGFRQMIKNNPNIKIIDSERGDFTKAQGNLVMTSFLKKYGKKINVVFAHNDDMALGAINAIEKYGLKPGKDIIIISVDGERAALEAIKEGKSNVSVECTPTLGPVLMKAAKDLAEGKKLPKKIVSREKVFTAENVEKELPLRTY